MMANYSEQSEGGNKEVATLGLSPYSALMKFILPTSLWFQKSNSAMSIA